MDPATLAIASLAGTVISAGVGAVGAIGTAQANAANARYAAGVARNNQIIADQKAQRDAVAGQVAAQSQDFRNSARLGGILAAQSASGLDTSSTSSQEVRQSAEQLGRLDTETVYNNALLQVRSDQAAATGFEAQRRLDVSTANNASTAGLFSAGSSILGGASSFSDKWLRFQNAGVPGF